jgi:hypothetical protein
MSRGRFQFHLSTLLVLTLVMGVVFHLNLIGHGYHEIRDWGSPAPPPYAGEIYGWPWDAYEVRYAWSYGSVANSVGYGSCIVYDNTKELSGSLIYEGLVGNVFAWVLLLAAAGVGWETLIRRRRQRVKADGTRDVG